MRAFLVSRCGGFMRSGMLLGGGAKGGEARGRG